ncbi:MULTISPECIES: KTSC domain-containing protein [Proteus]|uniref:KTSC domain-containing protein n=3 Tax=Proteus TaxID=583 RepID=A0A379F5E8_PROVU|nr:MULTISPECIES: KTSC domain-containing protein [Proteus]MBG2912837.1 KTSC domain-containing protein [Proteus terrae subsp. cibarius]NBL77605.1 KTSC domain-containing protein [Proteus sp. G2672]NBN70637.1 KTSC domain-containing protein [Proteus sp. G2618]AVA39787.1 KTSC domain-containing protein [Proteus mirabilis]EKU6772093.1 KTSC domain-containing protein [Proteus mirabilis]
MDKIYIASSKIISVAYDYQTKMLEIDCKHGEQYRYKEVPFSIYQGLMASNSKKKFFHAMIEHKYPYN